MNKIRPIHGLLVQIYGIIIKLKTAFNHTITHTHRALKSFPKQIFGLIISQIITFVYIEIMLLLTLPTHLKKTIAHFVSPLLVVCTPCGAGCIASKTAALTIFRINEQDLCNLSDLKRKIRCAL